MGETTARRLIANLDAAFAAAIAAEEDVAAADLAFSLSQDVPASADLVREGGSLLVDGIEVLVERVGHDFVSGGAWVVPLDRAVLRFQGDPPPVPSHDVFLGVVRRLARSRADVVVGTHDGSYGGHLVRATTAHLVIQGIETVAVPLTRVAYVKLARGGSADAL